MAVDANRAQKPARKLRKLLRKMPKLPTAEQVHDLRTDSRRLEATLQALSLDSGNNGRRILKQLDCPCPVGRTSDPAGNEGAIAGPRQHRDAAYLKAFVVHTRWGQTFH